MCGIIFSNNKKSILKQIDKLVLRGNQTWSLTKFQTSNQYEYYKGDGKFNQYDLISDNVFQLIHLQSMTGLVARHHPAKFKCSKLWHNGMIIGQQKNQWDTLWLCKQLDEGSKYSEVLSNIHGSFGCIFQNKDNELYVFRNELIPIYYNKIQLSSIPFENSQMLPSNTIFKIDLDKQTLEELSAFGTKNMPYYIL